MAIVIRNDNLKLQKRACPSEQALKFQNRIFILLIYVV